MSKRKNTTVELIGMDIVAMREAGGFSGGESIPMWERYLHLGLSRLEKTAVGSWRITEAFPFVHRQRV